MTEPMMSTIETALSGARGEDQRRIAQKGLEWLTTLLQKNADYGSAVWQKPVLTPNMTAATAILVRMSDKISRLQTLATHDPQIVGESFDDTISDLGAYSLLYLTRPTT